MEAERSSRERGGRTSRETGGCTSSDAPQEKAAGCGPRENGDRETREVLGYTRDGRGSSTLSREEEAACCPASREPSAEADSSRRSDEADTSSGCAADTSSHGGLP
ncbi:unnamed protein product, partial [Amoebophrya sp. A25]|eukprot:GSA25T00016740001.1